VLRPRRCVVAVLDQGSTALTSRLEVALDAYIGPCCAMIDMFQTAGGIIRVWLNVWVSRRDVLYHRDYR
jgi:hypothetical protein